MKHSHRPRAQRCPSRARSESSSGVSGQSNRFLRCAACAAPLLLLALAGCHKAEPAGPPIRVEPEVELVHPQRRDLSKAVRQPGYIYAYQQTAIYPKISGFVQKFYVDIGDRIKKGQPLADLNVPELVARYEEKKALVKLDEERVRQAESLVEVAKQNVNLATADIAQAQADVKQYVAAVERWESEVKRLTNIGDIVDRQVLAEAKLRLKSNQASRNASEAAVKGAQARELARKADLAKSRVDVKTAEAQVLVDKAAEADLKALVGYTHLTAPYDGIVVTRNLNEGDYVEPRYGDASVPQGGYVSQAPSQGVPLYVVAQTGRVRVYVDVPGFDANYVHGPMAQTSGKGAKKMVPGNRAEIQVPSLADLVLTGNVTRTSWALNFRSRTLRAEIDLPNKDAQLLPGMYVLGKVLIERRNVMTLPRDAVLEIGNENCCYVYENGKSIRTPVESGLGTSKWIEVFRKKVNGEWVAFTGTEEVIVGDLAELRDGEKVEVIHSASAKEKEQR